MCHVDEKQQWNYKHSSHQLTCVRNIHSERFTLKEIVVTWQLHRFSFTSVGLNFTWIMSLYSFPPSPIKTSLKRSVVLIPCQSFGFGVWGALVSPAGAAVAGRTDWTRLPAPVGSLSHPVSSETQTNITLAVTHCYAFILLHVLDQCQLNDKTDINCYSQQIPPPMCHCIYFSTSLRWLWHSACESVNSD